jgi:hypothetical protein
MRVRQPPENITAVLPHGHMQTRLAEVSNLEEDTGKRPQVDVRRRMAMAAHAVAKLRGTDLPP